MNRQLYEQAFQECVLDGGYNCNRLELFDVTDSTNEEISKIAMKGAPEGSLAVAAKQTSGQGRNGRNFFSPDGGNLYMSFLLRPVSSTPLNLLTPAAAVAVARAIDKVCNKKVSIKWVNDIFYREKKVCGIIAKAYNVGQPTMYIVIGIGVNVHMTTEEIPADIKSFGTLYNLGENTDEYLIPRLCAAIYSEYMNIYNDLDDLDFMKEYKEKSLVIGKEVSYLAGDKEAIVKVVDIDLDGGLVVEDENHERKTYKDGEIRISILEQ